MLFAACTRLVWFRISIYFHAYDVRFPRYLYFFWCFCRLRWRLSLLLYVFAIRRFLPLSFAYGRQMYEELSTGLGSVRACKFFKQSPNFWTASPPCFRLATSLAIFLHMRAFKVSCTCKVKWSMGNLWESTKCSSYIAVTPSAANVAWMPYFFTNILRFCAGGTWTTTLPALVPHRSIRAGAEILVVFLTHGYVFLLYRSRLLCALMSENDIQGCVCPERSFVS